MKINNYNEVVDQIVSTLAHLDAQSPDFQTDIYLYVGEDGTGSIDTYVNVGGNSWLNDSHINLYQRRPSYDEPADWAEDMTEEEAVQELISVNGTEYVEQAWQMLDDAEIEG